MQQRAATASTQVVVSYVDITSTTCTPGSEFTSIVTSTSRFDACSQPASSTQRLVKQITITSNDAANFNEINVWYYDNLTLYLIWSGFLPPNGSVHYTSGTGWNMLDDKLALLQSPGFVPWGHPMGSGFMDDGGSATQNAATFGMAGCYQGVAQKFSIEAKCHYRITTAGVGATYGEISIWKASSMSFGNAGRTAIDVAAGNGGQMLTRCGYTDTTSVNTSTGYKEVTVDLTVPIYPGELYYAVVGDSYTTTNPLYAAYLVNTLACGSGVYTAQTRPSLATSPQFFRELVNSTAAPMVRTILQ